MVTSGDVQDIIGKLSSDSAKTREDGIKLLNTWLEGERSVPFCKYLGFKTSKLKPNQTPHPETWPFLVKLLVDCISKEVRSSKRRLPKLVFAKTLRIVIQRAEDSKYSGKPLPLVTVVKFLFHHILDILDGVPSFQSEYGTTLRHILAAKDYRFHMRKKIYCGLVLLFMGKVESSLSVKDTSQYNPKEELFRCILTLHSLLENPPGDFPDKAREDIVKGFVRVFSLVRDEGKILRKLLECINTFFLKDGPNLDCQSLEIHKALPQFVFRCWLTSHDRSLKDQLILYSKLQLNLARSADDRSVLLEQLLDIVGKELDQSNILVSAVARSDTVKDDKFGTLTGTQYRLVELAAYVLYQATVCVVRPPPGGKRARKEHATAHLREGLTEGKWLWNAAFCCLIRNYYSRIKKDLFIYWFEGIYSNLERILNDANTERYYDGLLWTLRSLQELSRVLQVPVSSMKNSRVTSMASGEK